MTAKFVGAVVFVFLHNFTILCYACENEILPDAGNVLDGIVAYSPELINSFDNDKLYLDEERIFPVDWNTCVLIADSQKWYLPVDFFSSDYGGVYIDTAYESLGKKAFIQRCNSCGHRWEGGLFALRCPRCRSTDISNVLNQLF